MKIFIDVDMEFDDPLKKDFNPPTNINHGQFLSDLFCSRGRLIECLSCFTKEEIQEISKNAIELKNRRLNLPSLPISFPPPPPLSKPQTKQTIVYNQPSPSTLKYQKEQEDKSMAKHKGFFIVVEGIDGSGKDTLVDSLYDYYSIKKKLNVYKTAEPSNAEFGKILRLKLKDKTTPTVVDSLLFALDRAEHCFNEIIPHLLKDNIVICNRYKDSSEAYQSAQGLPSEWVRTINNMVVEPDIVILLDINPTVSLARRYKDTPPESREKFEKEDFLTKVRENYLRIAKSNISSTKYLIINAELPKDKVFNEVVNYLEGNINS